MRFPIKKTSGCACRLALLTTIVCVFMWPALADGYDPHGKRKKAPRWSNAEHVESGVYVGPDCVALSRDLDPRYEAGWDAWGRPVAPAGPDNANGRSLPLAVDFDIILKQKYVGGYPLDLTAGHFTFDPSTNRLALNGLPLSKDCLPAVK